MPDSNAVLVALEPPTVIDLDRFAERIITQVAAIPPEQPLSKTEQIGWAMARAWRDNPLRGGPATLRVTLKAA